MSERSSAILFAPNPVALMRLRQISRYDVLTLSQWIDAMMTFCHARNYTQRQNGDWTQVRHWTTHGPQGPQGMTSKSNDMCFKVSTLTTMALTPALRMACKSGSKSRRAWQNGGISQDTRKLDLMPLRLIRIVLKYPRQSILCLDILLWSWSSLMFEWQILHRNTSLAFWTWATTVVRFLSIWRNKIPVTEIFYTYNVSHWLKACATYQHN